LIDADNIEYESANKAKVYTPNFEVPEVVNGEANTTHSDIYAFGIVLYQMASGGSLPFITQGLENWRKAHQRESPEQLNSKLFPIISQCLNKDPTDRF